MCIAYNFLLQTIISCFFQKNFHNFLKTCWEKAQECQTILLLYEMDASSAFDILNACLQYANRTASQISFNAIFEMFDLQFLKYFTLFIYFYRDWEQRAKISILFYFQLFS